MNYETIEHRYEVLAHAVVAGNDCYDVAVVLRQHDYGEQDIDTFLPLLLDSHDHLIWQGGLTGHRRQAIRELNEVVLRLECIPQGRKQRPVAVGWLGRRRHPNVGFVGGACVCGMVCAVTHGPPFRYVETNAI